MLKFTRSVFSLLKNVRTVQLQSHYASYDGRQSKMLQKLLTGKRKVRPRWTDSFVSTMPKFESVAAGSKKSSKESIRRTSMLNKMFMRHITDLIASGDIGYELSGLGLQITGVQMHSNYRGVNIFWSASGTEEDLDYIEQKLASINKRLRHELHQMQVMGQVPYLYFVRNTKMTFIDDLNNIMEKADYGEDFTPTLTRTREKFSEENSAQGDYSNSSLHPMRHDVFGLNHSLIMGRVKQRMAQSKQAWKAYERNDMKLSTTIPFTFNTSFESIRQEQVNEKHQNDVLREFLQKRKALRKEKRTQEIEFNEQEDNNDYDYDYDIDEDDSEPYQYDEIERNEK